MSMHYFSMSVHYFSACLAARLELQEKEDDMFGKSKGDAAEEDRDIGSAQELQRSTATPGASQTISSISSGLLIVGKIVGHGAVTIFGHVEGELHASFFMETQQPCVLLRILSLLRLASLAWSTLRLLPR
jgi:hypothetical protein